VTDAIEIIALYAPHLEVRPRAGEVMDGNFRTVEDQQDRTQAA
jgi:hypothetical protein